MIKFILFDVDDTLYPRNSGVWDALSKRISLYLIERLHVPPSEIPELRNYFGQNFGTVLNGLRNDSKYQVDIDDYLAFVHDVPLEKFLKPDLALDAMLSRLPLQKALFTNSDAAHSRRIIDRLGIAHHFSTLIDIRALEFVNKPDPLAYQKALNILGAEARECVFVEDSLRNLLPAKAIGMTTILIGGDETASGVDYKIENLLEVEGIIGRLLSDAV